MKKLIAALLLCLPASAHAVEALVAKGNGTVIHIFNKPCESAKVLALSDKQGVPRELLRAGSVIWQGKQLEMCWAQAGADILVMDEDGDGGAVPIGAFKPADES